MLAVGGSDTNTNVPFDPLKHSGNYVHHML
jgi:hypothetical protein